MNKYFLMAVVILTTAGKGFSQSAETFKGIRFDNQLSWEQVKAKAKAENRYIFVDVFATWCGPCKMMERDVYPNDSVGNAMEDKFIAIKVQMDSTANDNHYVKGWYTEANAIRKNYQIEGYPSLLFFSPEGQLVLKELGYKSVDDFIKIVHQAITYNTELESYKHGEKSYTTMASLAQTVKTTDKNLGKVIAEDYINNYLYHLSENELCTKNNIDFIMGFPELITSKGKFFDLFYNHPDKIDSVFKSRISNLWVNYIISQEEIDAKLWVNNKPVTRNPDWKMISNNIRKKYNDKYAVHLVEDGKLAFYMRIKDWREYAKLRDEKIRKYPPKPGGGLVGDAWILNSDAWDLFLQCNDKSVLTEALKWSELSIKLEQPDPNVQYLDTKGNILYKLGRTKEAMEVEQSALQKDNINAKKSGEKNFVSDYNNILEKMKKGKPTWPIE